MRNSSRGSSFATARPPSPATALAMLLLIAGGCAAGTSSVRGISEVEILMKRGDGFYFNSRFEEAAEEYRRALELDPKNGAAYRSRGYAMAALDRLEDARRDFDRAIAAGPGDSEAYQARGTLSFRQGKYAEAIDDFDRVIEIDPWNSTARYYKALACEKIGRLREAVEAYKGYIHCTIPRDDGTVDYARERIRDLEHGPLR